MIVRTIGTVLLGAGFAMLAAAALIHDPTALDANIGAGALTLAGMPIGALGLAMTITAAAYGVWHRRDRPRTGSAP
ncbi:hypothetical protein NQ152_08490 [Microbacterium sp. zg.B48]|uniref:hypothetical protein n=1 Tax=Microbacterium sp. zg.B48 TaxID=2969408 RepID=UPI00214B5F0B|nr:hypothetical protein [Microbacterium sp. zg.B48]MCR2763546.1 hypothetical protein [Microbacterium sp. zg.B48]